MPQTQAERPTYTSLNHPIVQIVTIGNTAEKVASEKADGGRGRWRWEIYLRPVNPHTAAATIASVTFELDKETFDPHTFRLPSRPTS